MQPIVWINIPKYSSPDTVKEVERAAREVLSAEGYIVIVTIGADVKVFGFPSFTYPYWLLKIKMFFSKWKHSK